LNSSTSRCIIATAPTEHHRSQVKETESLWSASSDESESTSAASSDSDTDSSSDAGSCADVSCHVHEEQEVRTKVYSAPANFFVSRSEPHIAIEDYLQRLQKYLECSESCCVLAWIYIDRLIEMQPSIAVTPRSIHRLFAIAMVISVKFQDDTPLSNAYCAKVSGFRLGDLNLSEARFASLIDWKFYVSPEEYDCRICQVESLCASWGLSVAAVVSQLAMN